MALDDFLRLTCYFGEGNARSGRALALTALYRRRGLRHGMLTCGFAGFTARTCVDGSIPLTYAEDVPVIAAAVQTRLRMERALSALNEVALDGVLTLEPVVAVPARPHPLSAPRAGEAATKLTVFVGESGNAPPVARAMLRWR